MDTAIKNIDEVFETDSDLDSDDDSSVSSEEDDEEEKESTSPISVITVAIENKKTERNELFRVLLDSGTSRCMGTQQAIKRAGLQVKSGRAHKYKTAAGVFQTAHVTKIKNHRLLELNSKRRLKNLKVQVTDGDLSIFDFIFG